MDIHVEYHSVTLIISHAAKLYIKEDCNQGVITI